MSHPLDFPRRALLACCSVAALVFSLALPSSAAELPTPVEDALGSLLSAAAPTAKPSPDAVNTLLDFLATAPNPKKFDLVQRDRSTAAFGVWKIEVPLDRLIHYFLDPEIPGEAYYPSAVRHNAWLPQSAVLKGAAALRDSPLPPANLLYIHGQEYEETTPDTTSGCYYDYQLDRLFVLTAYKGGSALISVSRQQQPSSVGRKGAIVGEDSEWSYVYTPEVGTSLPMLGWAETFIYNSAAITVFLQSDTNPAVVEAYVFKWLRAGWAGNNMVKKKHILDGVERFILGLSAVLESPKAPTPQAIKERLAELKGMDDNALREALAGLAQDFERKSQDRKSPLADDAFRTVLKDGNYAASLTREQMINELLRLFMRERLGKTLPSA